MEEEGPDLSYLDSLNPAQLTGKLYLHLTHITNNMLITTFFLDLWTFYRTW
jgi:hypothetical protein